MLLSLQHPPRATPTTPSRITKSHLTSTHTHKNRWYPPSLPTSHHLPQHSSSHRTTPVRRPNRATPTTLDAPRHFTPTWAALSGAPSGPPLMPTTVTTHWLVGSWYLPQRGRYASISGLSAVSTPFVPLNWWMNTWGGGEGNRSGVGRQHAFRAIKLVDKHMGGGKQQKRGSVAGQDGSRGVAA